jgi:hypothetical protein
VRSPVRKGQQHGGHAHHVGSQAGRHELGDVLTRRHQHLATHVAALLDRSQLVFEVHSGGARFDHGLHQFEGVQHATKAGFRVSHDGREVIDVVLAFAPLDLVGAREGGVDLLHDLGHRIHGVQRLVGVHLAIAVGVASHLPAAQVDGLQARLDLLHGLVAGQRAQGVDEGLGIDQVPQLFSAALGQGVVHLQAAAQTHDVGGGVAALDALPAGVGRPFLFEGVDLLLAGELAHGVLPGVEG